MRIMPFSCLSLASLIPESYEPLGEPTVEVWECNWKITRENYPIPIGHPCLHRMATSGRLDPKIPVAAARWPLP